MKWSRERVCTLILNDLCPTINELSECLRKKIASPWWFTHSPVQTISLSHLYQLLFKNIFLSDYPGHPILLEFSSLRKTLSWVASTEDGGKKSSFTIQYLLSRKKCRWMDVRETSDLSISIDSLSQYIPENTMDTCSVRVCLNAKKTSKNTSCSREHKIYSGKCMKYPYLHAYHSILRFLLRF
jgi:hypothetical protein